MIEQYLQAGFISVFYLTVTMLILIIIASSWIDFKNIKLQKTIKKIPKNTKHQLITVVVYTQNNERLVAASLRSISELSYRNLKVLVMDNASDDSTTAVIRDFQKQQPHLNLQLIAKRKHHTKRQALLQVYKVINKGSLVVQINAGSTLHKHTLVELNKKTHILKSDYYSIAEDTSFDRSYGAFTSTLLSLCYEKWMTIKRHYMPHRTELPNAFACHVHLYKEQIVRRSKHQKKFVSNIKFICWFIFALTSVYFFYISFVFQKTELIMYSFLVLILWFCFIITSSESLRLRQKVSLLFVLPVSYLLLIVVPVIQYSVFHVHAKKLRTD